VSPDGLDWTRAPGNGVGGSVLGRGPRGNFDENHVGVMSVIKEGSFYRMWYDAKNYSERYAIGYVVSTNGIDWVRPTPNQPVYEGGDDPSTFTPDNVWSPHVLKEGATYRMWYGMSTHSDAVRLGHATMAPGGLFSGGVASSHSANNYTITFTAQAIPAEGSVLLTLPPTIPASEIAAGTISGFGAASLVVEPAAVNDALARGNTRAALLIRLPDGATAGPKTVRFSLATALSEPTLLLVQTFNTREVIEHGSVDLLSGQSTDPTPTSTPTNTPTPTSTPTNTPTPTSTPPPTNTPTPTSTPTNTPTPTSTPTNTPTPTETMVIPPTPTAGLGEPSFTTYLPLVINN
ncbi:MAG: hypothetical protein MI924_31185, partial [Chloroflexales bacterium]|nr:hypothetical protein [Chloroflexales bacterium]